ncbi:carboxypeptidase regulatory-like domain-containing protein [Flavobacterium xanthum]|uniref:Carboxypeptidase regulatory-like domain-containing protein n=1 Tax=Flavobacterium xanthum TaxID=69322 RepID=A0A1M7I0U2_9FLAO|nr:carboxypeptidase regulatory-like domain-containing protein [Flavobacterium xanthum]SHM34330.1 Carboxypeptidase regulatory-like domain-containing protein [Flavobacterium xanthum]
MKNIYLKISLVLLLVTVFSCSEENFAGEEFGTVEGKVVSAIDFKPLANVKVFSNPNSSIVFTDEEGKFVVNNVKVGDYSFEAQKDGYITKFEAATVNTGKATNLVFELKLSTTNNKPPTTPVLVSPPDNAIDQALELNLTWTATDTEKDSLKYTITVRKDNSNDIVTYSDISKTNYTLKGLSYSTKYYWQVSVSDGINPPVLSAVRTFTTIAFPNARFLFVKNETNNYVIYSGDEKGGQLQLSSSSVNSWRPRKNNQVKKIAFIRASGAQNHIYTMNPDGSGIFKVTNSVPISGFNSDFINFSWNASGSQIIYPYFDKLYRINNDGSGLTKIYQTPNGKFISECDWSNDGAKIALKVNDANGYNAEIYLINAAGTVTNQIISGTSGAIGGLNFTVNSQKLIFTRDVSGYEDANYRQLDTRVFQYVFSTNLISEAGLEKPAGTLDLDVRYSPNEAELIVTNTSNDGISAKNIVKYTPSINNTGVSRVILFTNASMPDWE